MKEAKRIAAVSLLLLACACMDSHTTGERLTNKIERRRLALMFKTEYDALSSYYMNSVADSSSRRFGRLYPRWESKLGLQVAELVNRGLSVHKAVKKAVREGAIDQDILTVCRAMYGDADHLKAIEEMKMMADVALRIGGGATLVATYGDLFIAVLVAYDSTALSKLRKRLKGKGNK